MDKTTENQNKADNVNVIKVIVTCEYCHIIKLGNNNVRLLYRM